LRSMSLFRGRLIWGDLHISFHEVSTFKFQLSAAEEPTKTTYLWIWNDDECM
jgi:hypothetical protein